jgi:hypothetical protein
MKFLILSTISYALTLHELYFAIKYWDKGSVDCTIALFNVDLWKKEKTVLGSSLFSNKRAVIVNL